MRPCTVTRRSCIASSSAACVFGGVRLISSASSTLANTGPGMKISRRRPVSGSSWMTSVPVTSDGIRSGVNWMREKLERERPRHRRDEQRLGEAGHADQQAVAAGEQRDQRLLDDVVVADDHLADLRADAAARLGEAVGQLGVVEPVQVGVGSGCGQALLVVSG